jgi:hypothetical protein
MSYTELGCGGAWPSPLAAPLANFLLAAVVYWFLFVAGTTTAIAPMLGTVPGGFRPPGRA